VARGGVYQSTASAPVEGPWALPTGWHWEPLGNLGKWCGGGTPSKARAEFWTDGTIPWVSPKDMKRALIDSSEDQITADAVAGSSAKTVRAGSVLCVMRSGILRHTFPVAVSTVDVTLNQDMRALTPRADVEPRYLFYYLQFTGNTVLQTTSKAGTTVNSIEASRLDRHPVPITDMGRQHLIVARIDELFAEVDDGEAALARARDDLATWRKALLKAAVTGELTADWRAANRCTETGADLLARVITDKQTGQRSKTLRRVEAEAQVDDLPTLPAHWVWSTVGEVGHVTGGITKNAKRDALPLRVPYLRVGNVYAGRVDLARVETIGVSEGEAERSAVKAGDLLIVEGNGSIDQIGRSAVWDGQIEPCLHQNHLIKVRVAQRRIADWIQIWLQSPWGRKELEAQASSTSGLHTLSISKVARLRCPVPPLAELEASLSMVERLTAEATAGSDDTNAMKIAAASLRQSILAAAFRGDLA
jgi:type I restriction enzyme S subunit